MKHSVFITGGTNGTGFAIAARFAKEGCNVVITSRNPARAEEAASEIAQKYGVEALGFPLDIRDEDAVKSIFSTLDTRDFFVETVVLNAADLGFGKDPAVGMDFFTVSVEEFQRVLETNLVWNFMIIRQAALRMKERKKGAIVFIGSNTAYRAIPNRTAYGASKGGMLAFSRSLAVDLGKYGIRSNVVMPGTIKTERWKNMGSRQIVNGRLTPIGDISDYEDIANAAWFFGSDQSKNVTGTEMAVDGGMSCQLYPQILSDFLHREACTEK